MATELHHLSVGNGEYQGCQFLLVRQLVFPVFTTFQQDLPVQLYHDHHSILGQDPARSDGAEHPEYSGTRERNLHIGFETGHGDAVRA